MKIIQNNPYRILGVYSNSPTKERLANHNRMKAFLKVGKDVSFPLDLPKYISSINRTEASVADAEAKLTLPKEQMLYAQFWFVKMTPLDDVAFNHLFAGYITKAVEIWQKKESASSLQNLLVCALMQNDYATAISYASSLYENALYATQLTSAVVGGSANIDIVRISHDFLDSLIEEIGCPTIIRYLNIPEWKSYVSEKAVFPIVKQLEDAVAKAKSTRKDGPIARWNAGNKLMATAKQLLPQLQKLLPKSDLQYQVIADKVGIEILQCGIDYFNDSEDPNAADNAMTLQNFAMSIVVGQMAKDRCKENVDILRKIIAELPPLEVRIEAKHINDELRAYCKLPDKIYHAITLLNNTKPHLQAIKQKLGVTNPYYLKISTQVVGNALHNIIEEVNQAQKYDPAEKRRQLRKELNEMGYPFRRYSSFSDYDDYLPDYLLESSYRREKFEHMKSAVLMARKALVIMDAFDMEKAFEQGRYLPNRKTLNNFLVQLGKPLHNYKLFQRKAINAIRKGTVVMSKQVFIKKVKEHWVIPFALSAAIIVIIIIFITIALV